MVLRMSAGALLKLAVIGCCLFAVNGQAQIAEPGEPEKVSYASMLEINSQDVMAIKPGMSKARVRQIMQNIYCEVTNGPIHNPWKVEHFGDVEIHFYITAKHPPFTPIRESQTTPVLFRNNKVIGTGINYYVQFKKRGGSMPGDRTAAVPDDGKTIEQRLTELKALYDKNIIDEAAYKAQQQRILDSL